MVKLGVKRIAEYRNKSAKVPGRTQRTINSLRNPILKKMAKAMEQNFWGAFGKIGKGYPPEKIKECLEIPKVFVFPQELKEVLPNKLEYYWKHYGELLKEGKTQEALRLLWAYFRPDRAYFLHSHSPTGRPMHLIYVGPQASKASINKVARQIIEEPVPNLGRLMQKVYDNSRGIKR